MPTVSLTGLEIRRGRESRLRVSPLAGGSLVKSSRSSRYPVAHGSQALPRLPPRQMCPSTLVYEDLRLLPELGAAGSPKLRQSFHALPPNPEHVRLRASLERDNGRATRVEVEGGKVPGARKSDGEVHNGRQVLKHERVRRPFA